MTGSIIKNFFRRLLFIVLLIVLATGGVILWRLPRKGWSPEDSGRVIGKVVDSGNKEIRNVLLVSIDTCRADHLSCYGYSRKTSPNIDALAGEGVLFNHVISAVPMTHPSHCSMLTGTIPPYHKVRANTGYKLDDSNVTLAEILRENGFATGAVTGAFVLNSQFGLNQGFETYDDEIAMTGGMSRFRNERTAKQVTELAKGWLDRNGREKFFLFAHYYDPHDPYMSHSGFLFPSLLFATTTIDRYDSEIAYTDHWVGNLTDKLKQMGVYDSTLIILTSDHGESFGEHGEYGHTYFIYHTNMHVPLIFKGPGISRGAKVYDIAGLIDIVPTVCGLLGIKIPEHVQGQNLSAYFRGQSPANQNRNIYCESLSATKFGAEALIGVIDKRHQYIETTRSELYDLFKDLGEKKNLIAKQPEKAKTLRDRLMRILDRPVGGASSGKAQLDAESLKKLQSLGYVGGLVNEDVSFSQDKPAKDDPKDLVGFSNSYGSLINLIPEHKYAKAKEITRELIEQRPMYWGPVMVSLAQILAVHPDSNVRDGGQAVFIAEHAAGLTEYKDAGNLDVLAMAYAEVGDFNRAVITAEMAFKYAWLTNVKDYANEIRERVELYKQKKPFRIPDLK